MNDREGALLREARALHDSLEQRVDDRLECANHLAHHARASIAAAKDLLSPPPTTPTRATSLINHPATLLLARGELRACVASQLGVVGEVEGFGVGLRMGQGGVDDVCRAIGVMGEVSKSEGARLVADVGASRTAGACDLMGVVHRTGRGAYGAGCCCCCYCCGWWWWVVVV